MSQEVSTQNQEMIQNLLVTGAGVLVGSAVMALLSSRGEKSEAVEADEDDQGTSRKSNIESSTRKLRVH